MKKSSRIVLTVYSGSFWIYGDEIFSAVVLVAGAGFEPATFRL